MVLQYRFLINDVDVTEYVQLGTHIDLNRNLTTGNKAEIRIVQNVNNVVTLTSGMDVQISRGTVNPTDNVVFIGNIKVIEIQDDLYVLRCTDPIQKLKYDEFTKSYDKNTDPSAGIISEIFKDIAEDAGFTVSTESSASGIILDKFIQRRKYRLDRMNVLAQILNWYFYYDYNKNWIRFEPKGYTAYGTTLEVGVNVANIPDWNEDIESMRNKITVEGATETDTRVSNETGDGSTSTFNFSYTPISTDCTIDGVQQIQGVLGSSDDYDYTIDSDLKTYTFVTPPVNSAAIVMKYTVNIPRPVTGKSQDSIDAHNGLIQSEVFNFNDVLTVDDATNRMTQLLALLKDGRTTTVLNTSKYDILPGYLVPVIDPLRTDKSGNYIVFSVKMTYGEELDVVSVGNEKINMSDVLRTIDERIRALEGPNNDTSEIVRSVLEMQASSSYVVKYFKVEKRSPENSLIANHPTLGWARDNNNIEIDCSGNGNHGTWQGTGVGGAQFTTSGYRLSGGNFNGSDNTITTSGVSIPNVVAFSIICKEDTNSVGVAILDTGKTISLDSDGDITTSGLINVSSTKTDLGSGTSLVYVEFDAITVTNPTIGYDGTNYFDGLLDECIISKKTFTDKDKTLISNKTLFDIDLVYNLSFQPELHFAFDAPVAGDNRGAYSTIYEAGTP